MSHQQLSSGAVRQLVTSPPNPAFNPFLQVINVKQVSGGGNERFRVIISDGDNFVQGMLATQLNSLVHANKMVENTIIRVKEVLTNMVQNKTVVILLAVDVMPHPGLKIGNPTGIDSVTGGVGASNTTQPMYNQQKPMMRQPQPMKVESPYGNNTYGQMNKQGGQGGGSNPYGNRNTYGGSNSNTYTSQAGAAPIVRSHNPTGTPITSIAQLNMYQNKWTIKARITTKAPVKTWSNARGEGCLFSIEMLDSSGVDIRATFFKEAVDKFYTTLQVDQVYTFSGGRLKVANPQWNNCKCQFEVTFDQNAEIHAINDDATIQHNIFEFKKIADLENIEPNKNVDLLCVVKETGPVGTVIAKKSGQELFKSELTIVDDSGAEVRLTIWGEPAKTAEQTYANQPIVAFKNLRVSDFGGRSLSHSGGAILHNPRIPETDMLRNWWTNQGGSGFTARSLSSSIGSGRQAKFSERKCISTIKDDQLGYNEKPDWITFKATFNFIKKDKEGGPWYTACANAAEPCKNRCKVSNTADGQYHCERCNQTYEKCVRRFIFSATLADDTSNTWVSLFDDQAKVLLGSEMSADEMNDQCFGDNYDSDAFDSYFAKVNFSDWIVNCKVKKEMVGDEARVKCTAVSLTKVDYVKESNEMLEALAGFQ